MESSVSKGFITYTHLNRTKFYAVNALHTKPWIIVPTSSPTDSFIMMTETSIIKLINSKMLEKYTGMNIKKWLTVANQGMREPQGSFLKAIFGSRLGN